MGCQAIAFFPEHHGESSRKNRARTAIELTGDHGSPDPADRILIERAKAGDREAFSEIYRRYRDSILRLARARLPDPSLAEEVVQDTFLRAFLALDRVDPGKPPGPWLATIAANLVIDLHRKRERWVPTDPADEILDRSGTDTTLEAILAAEGVRNLERALRQLPARQRRILLASVHEDLSPAGLAELENISEASVTSVVYRARVSVRKSLRRLATVIVAVRSLRRRMREQVDRVAAMGANGSMEAVASTCCWSVALFVTLALGAEEAGRGAVFPNEVPRAPAYRALSSADPSGPAPSAVLVRESRPNAGGTTGGGDQTGPVRASMHTGPVRRDATTPSSGRLRVEVVGPDGKVILYQEGEFHCDGTAEDLLPDSGPVRAAC